MARRKNNIGKIIILLFLIIILVLAGLMWFDYLGVIQAKKIFAPVYKLF
ncbi:MAG: flagellar protein FlbB, partial [Spirochaetaceae bacterium]|nr:flagellar protein FlbB [Spirochaetaceae bacterium]